MAPSDLKKVLLKQSCSLDYEDTSDSVKSMELTSVKNKNKGSMEAVVVKNKNNNLVERACSEDRGLRRRPKVVLIQSMADSFYFFLSTLSMWSTNNWQAWFCILLFTGILNRHHPCRKRPETHHHLPHHHQHQKQHSH